jgi:hypothetical protein
VAAAFRNKHQMNVKIKNAVSACSVVLFWRHTPKHILIARTRPVR